MKRKRIIATWVVLVWVVVVTSGCTLLNAAISAGIAYGLYEATN